MKKDRETHLGRILATILFSRINLNTAFRMTYPFLPTVSRGLGVTFEASSLLVMVRALAGFSGLVFGPLGDRMGHRATMGLGLALFGVGAFLVASLPLFWIAVVAFVLIGMAKAVYDPAMQAYVSARVPYSRRGRFLGITELAWAGGWFVGVPACGYLIGHFGWQSPFILMSAAVLPGGLLTFLLPGSSEVRRDGEPARVHEALVSLIKTPKVAAALAIALLIIFANEQFFIVYGAWMEHVFGLGPVTLGIVSTVVGVSELAGEVGVILFTDRLGKGRSVIAGVLFAGLFYVLVPLLSHSLTLTLLGFGLLFFTFEFAIVSYIAFLSELVPERRNTLMAAFMAATTAGRTFGAILGPHLWGATENLLIHGIISLVAMAGAFFLGVLVITKKKPQGISFKA